MSNTLSRRLLLRGLPMAPAMAKQAVGEIVKQATKSVAASSGFGAEISGQLHPGSPDNPWQRLNKWAIGKIRSGRIPDYKDRELRRYAINRARAAEDEDIEALGSISAGARRRMHEKAAYRQLIRNEIDDHERQTLYDAMFEKAEKGLLS